MKVDAAGARDVRRIFLLEGLIVGAIGSAFGVLAGIGLMKVLAQVEIRPPGVVEIVHLPLWWGYEQYALAGGVRARVVAWPPRTCRRGAPGACTRSTLCGARRERHERRTQRDRGRGRHAHPAR